MTGTIFNIQKYCIHDGPGIRTTVFLKGCSLRCFWCHNPESLTTKPQIQFLPDNCIGCGKCYQQCPVGAHKIESECHVIQRELCTGCGKCSEICYAEALVLRGYIVTANDVLDEIEKDRSYYDSSNGGVTFSGGEPLCQKDFLLFLLRECKSRGIHTAIETAGNVPSNIINQVIPFVDLWLYDIKLFDSAKHKKATGSCNITILENLKILAASGSEVIVRIPIIPGVNNTNDELNKIAIFISELRSIKNVELMPFHQMSENKYKSLGMTYQAKNIKPPSRENLVGFTKIFESWGLETRI